ncbi:MAG: hypothetical protein ACOYIR_02600 [Christensenellales bacterium]|jgi:hypothetical protein
MRGKKIRQKVRICPLQGGILAGFWHFRLPNGEQSGRAGNAVISYLYKVWLDRVLKVPGALLIPAAQSMTRTANGISPLSSAIVFVVE